MINGSSSINISGLGGDVSGPNSATGDDFVQFDSTTGKLVKDGGISLDTDAALTANSDSKIASQKAVKAFAQPKDATLTALAGLATGADKFPYSTGTDTFSQADITSAARTVLDDTTVAAMVDTLGGASSTGTGGIARAASPAFSGSPTVPTQSPGDNSTKAASTAYVDTAVSAVVSPANDFGKVYRTTNQTISDTTATAISFDTELFDTNALVNIGGNPTRITIATSGSYVFGAHVLWDNAAGRRFLYITKNGSSELTGCDIHTSNEEAECSFSMTDYFTAGDYIELWAYQTTGGNLDVISNSSGSPVFYAHILAAY